ncbi:hypothetical protein, partial [Streptococcus anginosus]
IIYQTRDELLEGQGLEEIDLDQVAQRVMGLAVDNLDPNRSRKVQIDRWIFDNLTYNYEPKNIEHLSDSDLVDYLLGIFFTILES